MENNLEGSVFLISSREPGNTSFGTGFVVHRDDDVCHILTCRHVLKKVCGKEIKNISKKKIDIGGKKPTKLCFFRKKDDPRDIAFLKVKGLGPCQPIRLSSLAEAEGNIHITGCYKLDKDHQIKPISGTVKKIEERVRSNSPVRLQTMFFSIEDGELVEGYSGAPVTDKRSGAAIGMATHEDNGPGYAILASEIVAAANDLNLEIGLACAGEEGWTHTGDQHSHSTGPGNGTEDMGTPDPEIAEKVRQKIREIFKNDKHLPRLTAALRVQAKKERSHDNELDTLPPEDILIRFGPLESIYLLSIALETCFDQMRKEGSENGTTHGIWGESLKIVGYLVWLSLSPYWAKLGKQDEESLLSMKIEAEKTFELEIVLSAWSDSHAELELKITEEEYRIRGKNSPIAPLPPPSGWEDDDIVQTIAGVFWPLVYPGTLPPKFIDKGRMAKMRLTITLRSRKKENMYMVVRDKLHPLNRPQIRDMVKQAIGINIFTMETGGSTKVLIVPPDNMEAYLIEYFNLKPKKWSGNAEPETK